MPKKEQRWIYLELLLPITQLIRIKKCKVWKCNKKVDFIGQWNKQFGETEEVKLFTLCEPKLNEAD